VSAADVVEVDVDAVRRDGAQQLGDGTVVIVERFQAELAAQVGDAAAETQTTSPGRSSAT
jgi:hypothetical protein